METMNPPLITIVVPVYKVEKYIHRCLLSIIEQTFRQYEVILVDDGSPDSCGQICDSYVPQFAQINIRCIVIHQENRGLSAARNAGIEWTIKNSSSEWITFIDSDDWIHPQFLGSLFLAAQSTFNEIAVGRYDRKKEEKNGEKHFDFSQNVRVVSTENFWVKNRTNATVAWGKLYKKSLFHEVRYPVGKYHEDEFVTYQLLFLYDKIVFVDYPVYHYFINDDSITTSDYLKRLPDIRTVFQKHIDFFSDTDWKDAYRLEVEKYAECLSEAIWINKGNPDRKSQEHISTIRKELIDFLDKNKKLIPLEKRKDIYIAAYPHKKWLIRIWGFIKEKKKK